MKYSSTGAWPGAAGMQISVPAMIVVQ